MYVCMFTKAFLLHLIKAWERTTKSETEIGKPSKWNGRTEYEIEKVKLDIKDHHIVQLFLNMAAY